MTTRSVVLGFSTIFLSLGCSGSSVEQAKVEAPVEKVSGEKADRDREAKIGEALAELEPADRKLAEEQRFCAVMTRSRLGSMGKPLKVMVNDQPAFLCCKGCQKKALADPDKTLAAVTDLKAAARDGNKQ